MGPPSQKQTGEVGGLAFPNYFPWVFGRGGAVSTPKVWDLRPRVLKQNPKRLWALVKTHDENNADSCTIGGAVGPKYLCGNRRCFTSLASQIFILAVFKAILYFGLAPPPPPVGGPGDGPDDHFPSNNLGIAPPENKLGVWIFVVFLASPLPPLRPRGGPGVARRSSTFNLPSNTLGVWVRSRLGSEGNTCFMLFLALGAAGSWILICPKGRIKPLFSLLLILQWTLSFAE
jgi:hypothetical protein